ncbi:MAG: S41 family peptidase [Campylobacterales bacterium]|nr:S41 family peptidase [Campylobacterales bacterium]
MINKSKPFIVSSIAIALISFYIGAEAQAESNLQQTTPQQISKDKLEAYIKFTKILNLIEQEYVDETNTTTLVDKALKGLVSNLDAHSSYMDKKEYKDMNIQTKGEFGGLGISVGMRDNLLTVIAPIQDTPAYKAGVKAGDVIVKLDDKATMGMSIDEAVAIMRGKPGSSIKLTIVRKDNPKPLEIKVTRAIIKVQSVFSKQIPGDILYIQVTSFDQKVVNDVKKVLKMYPKSKGIILDLRNNPGGLLDQAVGLTDLFVDKGIIVSQKGRHSAENITYRAKADSSDTKIPMVVLVDGGSASASEIVSGALQDLDRAVVVGEKTFGKGSVQVIVPLGKEEGLRLTVARYYLPSGRSIQAKGVEPDIIVHSGAITNQTTNGSLIKESELSKHLTNTDSNASKKVIQNGIGNNKEDVVTEAEINKDAQLKSAIDILKALIITANRK